MSSRKLISFVVVALVIFALFPQKGMSNQTKKKLSILVHASFSLAQKMGSVDEYEPGENDFPITPTHTGLGGGLDTIIDLSEKFAFQLSADYLSGAEVKKLDPSDGETYLYKTYDNINIMGSVLFKVSLSSPFFISFGGGMNILCPYADREVSGSLGSIIILEAPDKTINPMAALGGGVILAKKKMILRIEALYTVIFNYQKNSILLRLGFGF